MIETQPADGDTTAESIKFTIQDTNEVQQIVMKNCYTITETVSYTHLVSATMAIVFYYIPLFSVFSSGLKLIMATLFGAVYGALRYPVKEEITS